MLKKYIKRQKAKRAIKKLNAVLKSFADNKIIVANITHSKDIILELSTEIKTEEEIVREFLKRRTNMHLISKFKLWRHNKKIKKRNLNFHKLEIVQDLKYFDDLTKTQKGYEKIDKGIAFVYSNSKLEQIKTKIEYNLIKPSPEEIKSKINLLNPAKVEYFFEQDVEFFLLTYVGYLLYFEVNRNKIANATLLDKDGETSIKNVKIDSDYFMSFLLNKKEILKNASLVECKNKKRLEYLKKYLK